jgi:hypothetical protein
MISRQKARWLTADELSDRLSVMNRPARWDNLINLAPSLTPEVLRELVSRWWSDVEFPYQYGIVEISNIFVKTGFVSDDPAILLPTEPLTVYRGVGGDAHFLSGKYGLSWTTDPNVAHWFANRFAILHGPGAVYTAEVEPKHVLGMFNGCQESEVVVDPWRNLQEYLDDARAERELGSSDGRA